jgi:hypothetical protein
MVRHSIYRSLAKSSLFSLVVCFELAAFGCASLSSAAFAKEDFWMGCRGANLDARIVSKLLAAHRAWEAGNQEQSDYGLHESGRRLSGKRRF